MRFEHFVFDNSSPTKRIPGSPFKKERHVTAHTEIVQPQKFRKKQSYPPTRRLLFSEVSMIP